MLENFKDTRFIISSRPFAIREGWIESRTFEDAELQPMDLPDILRFVEQWHAAVREELRNAEEKEDTDRLGLKLSEVIKKNKSIRELATNPLLCAAICALFRERHQQLPSDRIELYEACCQMLLERRDREQQLLVEERDYPALSYRQNARFWRI